MQDCQRAKYYLAELPLGVVFGVYFAFKKTHKPPYQFLSGSPHSPLPHRNSSGFNTQGPLWKTKIPKYSCCAAYLQIWVAVYFVAYSNSTHEYFIANPKAPFNLIFLTPRCLTDKTHSAPHKCSYNLRQIHWKKKKKEEEEEMRWPMPECALQYLCDCHVRPS